MKSVLRLSIPVTLSAMLLPLSSLLDSVLAVKLMGAYAPDPVALYGLFSGGAVTVINLPVSICYGNDMGVDSAYILTESIDKYSAQLYIELEKEYVIVAEGIKKAMK